MPTYLRQPIDILLYSYYIPQGLLIASFCCAVGSSVKDSALNSRESKAPEFHRIAKRNIKLHRIQLSGSKGTAQ
ncbi:hypothetical protein BDV11DRAFT_186019 [Aspergillus similis]